MTIAIGNKATNLFELQKAGFQVPPFQVLSPGLSEDIFYQQLILSNTEVYAVRSSSEAEDSTLTSKAGYFYSEIGVKHNGLYKAYQKVCESLKGTLGGVIIQEFINTDVSGVLFTSNGNGQTIVNASIGLCKPVVEGQPCDQWILNEHGKTIKQEISIDKQCLLFTDEQLIRKASEENSLNKKQLQQLWNKGKEIAQHFKSPQDIEWGFKGNKLYILQARPITQAIPEEKQKIFFDNANIAESYSGIILPITISFARHLYQRVYYNLIHSSGVRKSKLNKHWEVFEEMLGDFYGRIYYNMNNWYSMTAFIPGYERNKGNLEQMITSNVKEDIIQQIAPNTALRLCYPFIVLKKILLFPLTQKRFKKQTKRFIQQFRKLNLSEKSVDDLRQLYAEINEKLVERWHLSVENDFMVMTFFGLLKKRFSEEKLSTLIRFKSKTTEQIIALKNILQAIVNQQALAILFKRAQYADLEKQIPNYPEINKQIALYFEEYGGRFANELKLESGDIEEDKASFYALLNQYVNVKSTTEEWKLEEHDLSGLEKWILKKFKAYAAQREEMRLLRSNGFSLVRKLVNQLGHIYCQSELIEKQEDVFYLKISEVFDPTIDFKPLIEQRKSEYTQYQQINIPSHFGLLPGEMPEHLTNDTHSETYFEGKACASGNIEGVIEVMDSYIMPQKVDFDILVTKHTDPGWSPLLGLVKGLVVEHGGILSHAAIVARELGIPTIIGLPGICQKLKSGQRIKLDGDNGKITVLEG